MTSSPQMASPPQPDRRLPARRRTFARLRALAPWVVGLGLLAYVLRSVHGADLWAAFHRAPAWAALTAIGGALGAYVCDTFATFCVLNWASVRLRFREVAVMRGATYFFAIINYTLGQAALIYVVSRHGVRALRASGIVLFIMGINLIVLIGFAGVSIAAGVPDENVPPLLRWSVYGLVAALPVYMAILAWKPGWLTRRALLAPLFDLGLWAHAKAIVVRLPHVATMMLAHWVTMRSFGLAVPPWTAALYLPILFAVAVMPISAQGIGTTQWVALRLFAPYAPGDHAAQQATVLAYSLYVLALWLPTQIVIGALCARTELGRAIRAGASVKTD